MRLRLGKSRLDHEKSLEGKNRKRELGDKLLSDSSSLTDFELLELILSYVEDSDKYLDSAKEFYDNIAIKDKFISWDALLLTLGQKDKKHLEFFRLMHEISKTFEKVPDRSSFSSYDAAGKYFEQKIGGNISEALYGVFLNKRGAVIKCQKLSSGKLDSVFMNSKEIVDKAILCNAKKVILAHNHPSGALTYSHRDLVATLKIQMELEFEGIELVEHYVVTLDGYKGILKVLSEIEGKNRR